MKYYTPELEEFHVGFEYELMDLALNMVDKEFRSDVITHGGDIDNALEWIKTNEVRVKHLDREDIESLGFVNLPDTNAFDKGEYQINFQDHTFVEIYDDASRSVFQGAVKNKSELKRLLKQLGI